MNQLNLILSLLGLLFVALGCVAYYVGERKAINPIVGFRIPPTYRDPEVWESVNTRAGLLTVLQGIFMVIAGLVLPKLELLTFLLIVLLPLAAIVTYGVWYAYHLEKTSK